MKTTKKAKAPDKPTIKVKLQIGKTTQTLSVDQFVALKRQMDALCQTCGTSWYYATVQK